MVISKIETEELANKCDILLTKLLEDEKKYNDNLTDYKIKDYYKNQLNNPNKVIFGAFDKDLIGYIYIKKITMPNGPDKNDVALIDGLYVEEEYRNQGIATKLINEANNWCKEKNIKYLDIHVIDNNIIAKKLYQKLGFNTFYLDLRNEVK